jgi:3-oxoacyl-[acyl-carrier protein] reductase
MTRQPVALVTGAAGGIGSAIVTRLAADGLAVAAVDRVESSGAALSLTADVGDAAAVRQAVDETVAELGGLDVVVNCAGTAHRESFEGTTAETFMADVTTNLLGTFLVCQAAVFPHMRSAGAGRLVNIASVSSKLGGLGPVDPQGRGGRTGAGYASSKAGVVNLTRWIAREVGAWGIRCNAVAPGVIDTPMTAGAPYEPSDIPAGRNGTPEEVAAAVSWLAGPESEYVHGTVLTVDGGMVRA